MRSLGNDLDPALVQRVPHAEIEVDFQTCLLIVKLVWQADAEQVLSEHFDVALALFEEGAQRISLARIGQAQGHVHWLSPQ